MPLIPSNAARIIHSLQGDNQVMANVFWFKRQSGDWTDTLTEEIISAWESWIEGSWRAIAGNTVFSVGIDVLPGPGATPKRGVWESAYAGTGGPSTMPYNVALCVTLRTTLQGRAGRGRIYHGPLPNTAVVGNRVTTLYLNSVVNAYAALRSNLMVFGVQMCVASSTLNRVPRSEYLLTPVSAFAANNVLDSQRRRLPGRGT